MAALLALLPAAGTVAGAATAAGTAGSVLTGLSAAASVVGGLAAMAQSNQQADASELQARQIELQGRMDAVQVNDELMKTMSLNNVAAAASGLQSAGTVEYAQQASMAKANEELRIQRMNTDIKKAEALDNAKAQRSQGVVGLLNSTLTAGERIGSSLAIKKKTNG